MGDKYKIINKRIRNIEDINIREENNIIKDILNYGDVRFITLVYEVIEMPYTLNFVYDFTFVFKYFDNIWNEIRHDTFINYTNVYMKNQRYLITKDAKSICEYIPILVDKDSDILYSVEGLKNTENESVDLKEMKIWANSGVYSKIMKWEWS